MTHTLAPVDPRLEKGLSDLFQDRVRFNKVERLVYSHDMGVMPEPIRAMFGCMPDGVCQPVSADEVARLARLANDLKVPLVPRGAGTSGFGGSVPARNGVTVDFIRMKQIRGLDEENATVTVEPGVTWADLQRYLNARGYALRTYPSSANSATIAGWIAQGGVGYGGYEFGYCAESVESVDLVLPDGSLRHMSGQKLDLVNGLCGITGFIVSATLRVKAIDDELVTLAGFDRLEDAGAFLKALHDREVAIWSVSLATPAFISLKQQAAEHAVLPENRYYVTMVYPRARKASIEGLLRTMVTEHGGEVMRDALAQEEWREKFYPMRFKKLGPTLVASEVVIPVSQLGAFVSEVEKKYKGTFALEGTMVHNDQIAILGFMLADERKFGFPLVYANALSVMEIGEKLGGRVYTTGLYFAEKAKDVLGEPILRQVWDFKRRMDPNSILNPGKVIPPSMDKGSPAKNLLRAMSLANTGKEVFSLAGRLLDWVQGDTFRSPLPEGITKDTFSCALCGYCRDVCTVFDAVPWESNSPRGKYFLLNQYIKGNIPLDEEVTKALYSCTTCKKCDFVCQIKAHNAHNWMSLRPCFHDAGIDNTGLAMIRQNVLDTNNFWGVTADKRYEWLDVPTQKTGKIGYWAGCWANVVMPNMPQNATRILDKAGVEFVHLGEKEGCCGLYLSLGGYMDDFKRYVAENLKNLNEAGIETLVLSCPGCYATFAENYPAIAEELGIPCDIRFRHLTYFLSELVTSGKLKFEQALDLEVTYHDSCHVGRWFGHYEEPRNVIKAIPGVELKEMEHNRKESLCCGLVSAFDSLPTVAHSGQKRVGEAEATGCEYLITNCAGCGSQFNTTCNAMGTTIKQKDLTDLVAEAMGLPTQDPSAGAAGYMQAAVELLKDSGMKQVRPDEKGN